MEVTLNPAAINLLFHSQEMRQYLAQGAEETARLGTERVRQITKGRATEIKAGYNILEEEEGLAVEIGILLEGPRDFNASGPRLARKIQGEEGGWRELARQAFA